MNKNRNGNSLLPGVFIRGSVISLFILFFGLYPVYSASNTVTSSSQFENGTYSNTESISKEGELKLSGDGTWGARVWRTPFLTLNDGTTFARDASTTYMLIGRDTRFVKYITSEDRWKELANAPHMPYSGADMVVLGDNIYVTFGGYQKTFSKYSIGTNSWTDLTDIPDFVYSGSSIQTDGTNLFVLRGGTTSDFWKYNPTTAVWSTLSGPPATVSSGADLIFDNSTGTDYLYTPRGANTTTFYRYDITLNSWSTMASAPATLNDNGNISISGDYIYTLRGTNTTTFYRYSISGNSWTTLASTPSTNRYVGTIYNPTEDLIYVFRGNNTYDWWKYDPNTDTFLGPTDLPNTPGSGADIIYANNKIFFRRGNNSTSFYSYNIATGGTWVTLSSSPASSNDDTKGVKAGSNLYYFRGSNTNAFYIYDTSGGNWSTGSTTPSNASYGASMAYPGSGDYIYGTRGALTTAFWRYSISGDTWSDAAVADLPTGALVGYGSRLVSDSTAVYAITGSGVAKMYKYTIGTDSWSLLGTLPFSPYWGTDVVYYNGKIYAQSGYYKTDFWEYDIATNIWSRLPNMAGYYASDIGPYNGGSIAADVDSGLLYSINGTNISRLLTFDPSTYLYPATGTWTSGALDLTYVSSWNGLSFSSTEPSDSEVTFESRSSADKITWSSWQNIVSGTISSTAQRYLQLRSTLAASTDRTGTPTLYDVTVSYNGDTTPPSNPTAVTATSQAVSGSSLTSGVTYKHANPYFSWSGASDTESTIAGYYVYFGTGSIENPQSSGNFQTEAYYTVTTPMSSGTYYLRIQTKDSAGNVSSAYDGFTYVYSGVSPPTSTTHNSSSEFVLGTSDQVTVTSDQIKLQGKSGFWQQQRLTTIPATTGYGASFAKVTASGKMYAFRGNNTSNFYEYDIATDTWTSKATTPATVYQGGEVVEGPTGYLYGFPGKNLTTFWRYDITNDQWTAAADAPLALYYGSAMIYDGSQYIYALRGNSDDSFMRYDTASDTWDTLTNTDFGSPTDHTNNNVYVGGDITYDGSDTIYAIQGNTFTGFSAYSIQSDSWTTLTNLPVLPYDGSQISYDSTSEAVYYISGWSNPFIYKYDISTQTWTKLSDSPAPILAGGAMRNVDGILYILRGGSTTTFWKYNIAKSSWQVPNVGLFGTEFRGTDYRPFGYGAEIVKGNSNYYYLGRGNFDNLFVRYDATTGEAVRMSDIPEGMYIGSAMTYDSIANKIYLIPSQYVQRLYVYDIASDTWSEESSDTPPASPSTGSSFQFDGSRYIYWLRGGSTSFYRFDTQGSSGTKWTTRTNTPASIGYGGDLVYNGGYIYAPRGNNTLSFYRYDVSGNTWSDPAVADLPSGGTIYNDGFIVNAGSDLIIACRGGNQVGCYQYVISTNTWSAIDNAPANIYQGGSAASNHSDRMYVIAGNGTNTFANGLYSYVISSSTSAFEESGSYTSPTIDLTAAYKFANVSVNYTDATNNVLGVSTRTSADDSTYSSWATATELKTTGSTNVYKVNSTPQRYIQVKFTLQSTDGIYSGIISSYSIDHYSDTTAPSNPSALSAYSDSTLAVGLSSNNWYSSTAPYFSWPGEDATGGATDSASGSGLAGYYLSFSTSSSDPYTIGSLRSDTSYQGVGLTSGETYYLSIKSVDNAGNTAPSVWQPFIYKLDNSRPTNPSTVVANPPGYTATNSFTFSWSGATDSESGVASYCYKTGADGATDTCTASTSVSGIEGYKTGANTFYVRTKDNAGNYSSDYVTASYYYSSVAPSAPTTLEVSPSSNTVNAYAFTWAPPDVYYGSQSGLRYYYSVNALPTSSNVNTVGLEVTYLASGAYASQNGTNTMYVVAKDEAGNIDYNNYASVDFSSNTSSPGIPINVEISDVSVKETESWKIALSWEPPTDVGSGLSTYKVYRSAVEGATCDSSFSSFDYISSTTVKSFVDTDLEQTTYGYCVKACTSTNVCSDASSTETLLPDGRWRVPPSLIDDPAAVVKTRTATISWVTGRKGSSFVKYGKSEGDYGSEVGSSDLITSHEIELTGLDPGATYYYKVLWTDEDGNLGESDEYSFTTDAAPLVSSVTFSNISLYEAYVVFTVKNAVNTSVQYGESVSYGAVESTSTSSSESTYTVPLKNLTEGTLYHLRIVAEDSEGNTYNGDDYTFQTLPVPKLAGVRIQQVEGLPTATLRLLWVSNTRLTSIVTYFPTATPSLSKDSISLTPKTSHEVILKDLIDDTPYTILIKGKDSAGNESKTETRTLKTASDLRPPEILNANVETTIVGVGEEARAQILISWDTDEPGTSQVSYGEGTSGQYTSTTQEDGTLTVNHSLTIPGLSPSKIYHFRISSKDKNKNDGASQDIVVITPNATKDALNLVVNKLSKTFGFLKKTSLK